MHDGPEYCVCPNICSLHMLLLGNRVFMNVNQQDILYTANIYVSISGESEVSIVRIKGVPTASLGLRTIGVCWVRS